MSHRIFFFLAFFASNLVTICQAQNQSKMLYVIATEKASESLRSGDLQSKTNNFIDVLDINSIAPLASFTALRQARNTNKGELQSKLDRIFKITYTANINSDAAVKLLSRDTRFEVVQKAPNFHVLSQPNDPLADSTLAFPDGQFYLKMHGFYNAWDIETGDTNVVIGVIDTGFDLEHEDLQANLSKNWNDTIDGINNDMDDFFGSPLTDNFTGWDMANFDNDPRPAPSGAARDHGTMVLGEIAATPNNGIGVSGTAYNCRYLPIKASPDTMPGWLAWGYDGLYYAMTHGAGVINISWGDQVEKDPILHELAKSATLDFDALIVAAAGNVGKETYYYPASMDYVLSVSALIEDSTKWWASTFNTEVDVCALGYLTLTTQLDDTYDTPQGTSNSAPIVAGAAGLLRSHFPTWNAVQIGEQIRVSGAVIDTISENIAYKDRLGKMLDIRNALTDTTIPSVRIRSTVYIDNDGFINASGDTLAIHQKLINYLAPTSTAVLTLQAYSSNMTVLDSIYNLGALGTMDSASTESAPYLVYIHPSLNSSEELVFRLKIEDGNYHDFQYFRLTVNPAVITTNEKALPQLTSSLNLFPNPSDDILYAELEEPLANIAVYQIISSSGVVVATGNVQNGQSLIDLTSTTTNLPQGIYSLKINGHSVSAHSTFVKN